jgi:hypoxanthine phosphoribosyltransferase
MSALLEKLKSFKPKRIRVVSLLIKRLENRRISDTAIVNGPVFVPDFVGFSIPDLFVVGYAVFYTLIFHYGIVGL